MITIAIEQPPETLSAEAREYVQRVLIHIAGALEEVDAEIQELQRRVAVLESR